MNKFYRIKACVSALKPTSVQPQDADSSKLTLAFLDIYTRVYENTANAYPTGVETTVSYKVSFHFFSINDGASFPLLGKKKCGMHMHS